MHRVTLVLCTSDERYAELFVNAVEFYSGGMFRTRIIHNMEPLPKLAEDSDVPDIILMESELFEAFCREKGIQNAQGLRRWMEHGEIPCKNVCVLTESEEQKFAGIDLNRIPGIYKYRDMESILEDIQRIIQSRRQGEMVGPAVSRESYQSDCVLIGFYSPLHRTGQSTYARKKASEAGENAPVLYLHLDSYVGDTKDGRETLADLMYYFHQEDMVFQRVLQKVTWKEEGFYQILPMPLPPDLWDTTVDEWKRLFLALKEKSIYQRIFIDFGDGRIDGLFELLEMCDVIYMPVEDDPAALRKLTQYERTLVILGREGILEKTRRVYLKTYGEGTDLERTAV